MGNVTKGLITNRSQADVAYALSLIEKRARGQEFTAAEQADWLAGLRGSYTPNDVNRVSTALNGLRTRMFQRGYKYLWRTLFEPMVTNWNNDDYIPETEAIRYTGIIEDIHRLLPFLPGPKPRAGNWYDLDDANNVEKLLQACEDLMDWLDEADKSNFRFGEIFMGEIF